LVSNALLRVAIIVLGEGPARHGASDQHYTISNSAALGGPEQQCVSQKEARAAGNGVRSAAIVPTDSGTNDAALSATVYTVTQHRARAGSPDDVAVITMAFSAPPLPAPLDEKTIRA